MSKLLDLTSSIEGNRFYLFADGSIFARERPNDVSIQHLPLSQRPQWALKKLESPPGKVTRISAGHNWDLEAITADGRLWRRERDVTSMVGERYKWVLVELEGQDLD